MNRRVFMGAAAAGVLAQGRRPSVILILADDLGWGDIGANGCPDIRTPNTDGVASSGVRFTQSYANAPECTPTRAALLTGNYQHRIGGLECAIGVNNIGRYDEAAWLQARGELGLPASERTLAARLRRLGYETAISGKWHLGYLEKFWPDKHGFDYCFAILGGNADYFTHEEQNEGAGQSQLIENGRRVQRSGYMTDVIADSAIAWLKRRDPAKPFFLYLPFTAPHTPIQAVEDYDPSTRTAPHRQKHRPTFARMVQRMDARIGDVLKFASDNTLVIFSSDNGADVNGRNDPFKGRKSSVWEGGLRSPLHIRWPRVIPAGRTCSQVAMSMDVMPTVLAAAGAPASNLDGIDLLPFITGQRKSEARTVCWRYKRAAAVRKAIRHGDWKYLDDSGSKALHNLAEDPGETRDLLRDEPVIAQDLQARLQAWEKKVEAPRLRGFGGKSAPPAASQ
jgi:arylsulfatase A-like enzyme